MNKHKKPLLLEDVDFVKGIANGSSEIIELLYKQYFPMAAKLIINNNGSIDDAKDIFQEAIIILHDRISGGRFELNSKLKTFIYAVCRNLWLKSLNKRGHFSYDIEDYENVISADDELDKQFEKDKQFAAMESALINLGQPCQGIIKDYYIHHLNMQDICDKYGYTNTDNAKTQKYKCLQRLKKLFFS